MSLTAASPYRVRLATSGDVEVIAHHRVAMFRDMGILDEREAPAITAATRAYLAVAMPSGEYRGWIVEMDGQVVAGGGALVHRMLPRPGQPQGGEDAYLLNVYTEPAHRRRGLARALMDTMLTWCRDRRVGRVALHASNDGRPLYLALGFEATNEMRIDLDGHSGTG